MPGRKYIKTCIFLLLHFFMQANPISLIHQMILRDNTIFITPNEMFKQKYLKDDFFARYSKKDVDLKTLNTSILIMPFIMSVMPIIWRSNQVWEIDEMDQELFNSLLLIKKVFMYIYPKVRWDGELKVHNLVCNTIDQPLSHTFAMPFSGGVDSTHTSISHWQMHQLLITVRDHKGFLNDVQWHIVQKNVTTFAQHFGHECVFVDSNYQRFIKDGMIFRDTPALLAGTPHGLGWVGIAAPILMAKKCAAFKIAGSVYWDYPVADPICPMVDDNITFANITVAHDGFDCTRADKVDQVVSFFKDKKITCPLYVCQKSLNGTNCCYCEKCIRTIAELMALGETSFSAYGFNIGLADIQLLIQKVALKWSSGRYWRLEGIQKKIKEKKLEDSSSFLKMLCDIKIENTLPIGFFYDCAAFVAREKQVPEKKHA